VALQRWISLRILGINIKPLVRPRGSRQVIRRGELGSRIVERAQETVMFGKTVIVDLFKSLKMIFNKLIILRFLWLSRAIYRRDIGDVRFSFGE
jgi:hypothetical protein